MQDRAVLGEQDLLKKMGNSPFISENSTFALMCILIMHLTYFLKEKKYLLNRIRHVEQYFYFVFVFPLESTSYDTNRPHCKCEILIHGLKFPYCMQYAAKIFHCTEERINL